MLEVINYEVDENHCYQKRKTAASDKYVAISETCVLRGRIKHVKSTMFWHHLQQISFVYDFIACNVNRFPSSLAHCI